MALGGPSAMEMEVHTQGSIFSHSVLGGDGLVPRLEPKAPTFWLSHSATSVLQLSSGQCAQLHGEVGTSTAPSMFSAWATVCDCPWAAHSFTYTQNTHVEETQLSKLGGGEQGQEWSGLEKPQFPAFRQFKKETSHLGKGRELLPVISSFFSTALRERNTVVLC